MLQFYRKLHPAGRLGIWGLLILIATGVVFFAVSNNEGIDDADFPGVVTLTDAGEMHVVQLGPTDEAAPYDRYQPVTAQVRDRVLQRLGEFRAAYKQLGPRVAVEVAPGEAAHRQVAQGLIEMLARYGMNAPAAATDREAAAKQPIILYCSPEDLPVAYALLSAVAPYIRGNVAIIKDRAYPASRMRLRLQGTLRFTEAGAAVFVVNGRAPSAALRKIVIAAQLTLI